MAGKKTKRYLNKGGNPNPVIGACNHRALGKNLRAEQPKTADPVGRKLYFDKTFRLRATQLQCPAGTAGASRARPGSADPQTSALPGPPVELPPVPRGRHAGASSSHSMIRPDRTGTGLKNPSRSPQRVPGVSPGPCHPPRSLGSQTGPSPTRARSAPRAVGDSPSTTMWIDDVVQRLRLPRSKIN